MIKMQKKRFCVIGYPIKHSLSPLMHNAVFRKLGLDCEYGAFEVRPDELKEKLSGLRDEGFTGINVTIPHKVAVMKFMDELSEDATLAGAVNTVKFSGETVGYNTDGIGCMRALREAGVELKGKKVLMLGAGGASRAISAQLMKNKAEVWVSDKLAEKAVKLAEDLKKKVGGRIHTLSLEEEILLEGMQDMDLVVNATPVGMHPNSDATPINPGMLRPELTVMDIVYNPVKTKLLEEAEKKGCRTISGVGMFVHQGAESLRIWLDIEPSVDVMKKAVLEELRKR